MERYAMKTHKLTLTITIPARVKAKDEEQARRILRDVADCFCFEDTDCLQEHNKSIRITKPGDNFERHDNLLKEFERINLCLSKPSLCDAEKVEAALNLVCAAIAKAIPQS